jgi:WD40 repeat protein
LRTVIEALAEFGFTAIARHPGYALDPARTSLRTAVRKAADAAPVVVVYYTGHGTDLEGGTFYLVGKNSRRGRISDSALAARDLLELVVRRDDHDIPAANQPTVLVILDCCFATVAAMEILRDALYRIGNPHVWIIATAGPSQYAVQGRFAVALNQALQQPLNGPSQQFISMDSLVQAINNATAGTALQVAHLFAPATGSTGIPPFFPVPGYAPDLAGRTVDEQHWLSRSRAGPEETTTRYYLTGVTGRLRATEDLAAWITGPEPDDLAVVTGSPGTGKSALLSLPVLLTLPNRRADMLTPGPSTLIRRAASLIAADTPIVAVHARGLTTDQTAAAVAEALGRHARSASGLLEDLEATPASADRVVVIDAVDEAISPHTLLTSLARPLAGHPRLRVVAGTRRHVLPAVTRTSLMIDLDNSNYHDPQALTGYITDLLTATAEPGLRTSYQEVSQAEVAAVADAIARRAIARKDGPESFLLARLLALSVRDKSEPVDVTSPAWKESLPVSVADAFDEDLARLGDKEPLARTLLAALAWAKGPGLPWETIWAPVALAVAAATGGGELPAISDDEVRWLLDKAGAYIVEDAGPGQRSVYRLFHDVLATHLRKEPGTEQRRSTTASSEWEQHQHFTEMSITRTLLGTVQPGPGGRPDWLTAHPYLTTYLAQHATAAGPAALAELSSDAGFLAVADPVTLTPLLSPGIPDIRETARIYRRARPLLGENPSANAAYLAEARQALSSANLAAEPTSVRPMYLTCLAEVRRDDSLLTITIDTNWVTSVAFGTDPDGHLLLATGSDSGPARIWDPLTGTLFGEPLGHGGAVLSVAFGTDPGGRLLLATGSTDGTARIWDPLTGTPLGDPLIGHADAVTSVAFGTDPGGRLLLATASQDRTARLWDPFTGAQLGDPLTGHTRKVTSVAFGTGPNGDLLLATGSTDGTARIWDPLTNTPLGEPLNARTDTVTSVTFGTEQDGRLLLATGSDNGMAQVWDPLDSDLYPDQLPGEGFVMSLAFGTDSDGSLLLAAGNGDTILLWDPLAGASLREPLIGHTGRVMSVTFDTDPGGRLLLATGGKDGTARIWDPLTGTPLGESLTGTPLGESLTGHTSVVMSVAFATAQDGRLLLATGSKYGTARIWDPLTGTPLGEPLTGHRSVVMSVAFATAQDGHLLLATGSTDGTARTWDPLTGTPLCASLTGHAGAVLSVAFGTDPDSRLLLATGSFDGTARIWDPLTGTPLGATLTGHTGAVLSVAFGTDPDGRLLLATSSTDGTARIWDPLTGMPLGAPLTGHTGTVTSVAFGTDPDGGLLLATSSTDGTARIWDPLTGMPLGATLAGHTGTVTSVAFGTAPDRALLLVTASHDRTIMLWDLAGYSCIATFRRRSSVHALAISGSLLGIGDKEGVTVVELVL